MTPEQADEAVHDLLHTIDPKNHRPIQCRARNGGRVQGYAINHEMEVVMTSTGHYALASVFVAFEPRECVVSYYRKAVRWTNDDPGPDVPREELVPDKPVAAIPYDDPELLEKVYDALARLKVKVPRTLRPKIKQRQAELTKAASTPTNNRLRKCNAKSKH